MAAWSRGRAPAALPEASTLVQGQQCGDHEVGVWGPRDFGCIPTGTRTLCGGGGGGPSYSPEQEEGPFPAPVPHPWPQGRQLEVIDVAEMGGLSRLPGCREGGSRWGARVS